MSNVVHATNSILDRASDFKYFVLLATFLLFLDSTLILYGADGSSLQSVTFKALKDEFMVGSILLFICLFCLFLSFISKTLQYIVTMLLFLIPNKVWLFLSLKERTEKFDNINFVRPTILLNFAIKNNNKVAYEEYLSWKRRQDDRSFSDYSFSFLIVSAWNGYAWLTRDEGILSNLLSLDTDFSIFTVDIYVLTFTIILYFALFFFGIFVGCGIIENNEENKISLPNHNIDFGASNSISPN